MGKVKKVILEPNCTSLKLLSSSTIDERGLEEKYSNGNMNLKPNPDIAKSKISKTPTQKRLPNILSRKVPVPLQLIAVTREADDKISLYTIDNKVQCINGPNFTELADYSCDLGEIETKCDNDVEVKNFSYDDQALNDMRLVLNKPRLEGHTINEKNHLLNKTTYRLPYINKVPYESGDKKKDNSNSERRNEIGENGPVNEIKIENKDDYSLNKQLDPKAKILKVNSPFSCVNVDEMSKPHKTVHETSKLKSGENFFITSQEAFKSEKPILALYEEIVSIKKNKRRKKRRSKIQKKGKNIDPSKTDWCIKIAKTNKRKKQSTISNEECPELDELIIVDHSANENSQKYNNSEEINFKQNYQSLTQVNNTLNENDLVHESLVELDATSDPIFRCNDCDSLFSNERLLMEHRKILHGSFDLDKYQKHEGRCKDLLARYVFGFCAKCYKLGDCKVYENEFLCQKCCKPQSLHVGPKQKLTRTCKICSKEICVKRWNVHMTEIHGNETYKCNTCNYEFKCKRYLQKHSKIHEENDNTRPFLICSECPKSFKANDSLRRHIKNFHTSKTSVECDLCYSKLSSARNLQIHMETVHCSKDGMKRFQCEICKKYYKSEKHRSIHTKNYHPDTLPKCAECGLRTANTQRLNVHMMHCARKLVGPVNKEAGPSKIGEEIEDLIID